MTHELTGGAASEHDAPQLAASLAPTLALLREVAAEGNITRAAERLGTPQPTVSRALAQLTDRLGMPVLARAGRGVQLTRVGALLAGAADSALRALETGCRSVVEELDPERGQVILGFQHTMGSGLVPGLLRGFRTEHPHVRFGLVQGARADLLERMLDGEIDLCLAAPLPAADARTGAAALREEPLVVVLYGQHRLARKKDLRLLELQRENFIATRPGYGLRQIFQDLCARAGFTPTLAFECEEVDTVRGLVAAELGVALLPPAETGPLPGTVEIPLRPAAHRTVGLTWPENRPLPPAVRGFRDYALGYALS